MTETQKILNYLNTVLAKLAFDGYRPLNKDAEFYAQAEKPLYGAISEHEANIAVLQESRIKEAHIVQLMETRQMPYPFQTTVYTANIDSHVSLIDVVLYIFTQQNMSNKRCVQGSDVEKQTSVLPYHNFLITKYVRDTIPHDGISNG